MILKSTLYQQMICEWSNDDFPNFYACFFDSLQFSLYHFAYDEKVAFHSIYKLYKNLRPQSSLIKGLDFRRIDV